MKPPPLPVQRPIEATAMPRPPPSSARRSLAATTRSVALPDDSADGAGARGWLIIAAFFGLLGTWAALAPLNGAVVAEGVVKVDGNHRPVQHVEGGIVRKLLVREGQAVVAGQPLVELDDSELAAGYQVLDETVLMLTASEARLESEQRGDATPRLPPLLSSRLREARVEAIWNDQTALHAARLREQDGEVRIAEERMGQLATRMEGSKAQLKSLETQDASLNRELATLRPLLEQGIVTRQRLLELERTIASVGGQIGQTLAAIAGAEQAVAEQRGVATQARLQRATAIAQELRDVRMKLVETVPKLDAATTVRKRSVLRSPSSGRVVGLGTFSPGAVVGRGERLMDIVPDGEELVVEARIAIADVTDVDVGVAAEVHLTGLSQKSAPALAAEVVHVSADRLVDQRSGSYYAATVRLDPSALDRADGVRIRAGMGASVTIPTRSRSALQYLIDPFRASFRNALRER